MEVVTALRLQLFTKKKTLIVDSFDDANVQRQGAAEVVGFFFSPSGMFVCEYN